MEMKIYDNKYIYLFAVFLKIIYSSRVRIKESMRAETVVS